MKGGAISDWNEQRTSPNVTSYINPRTQKYIVRYGSMRKVGRLGISIGSKYAGYFNGVWSSTHTPSILAYQDFMYEYM